MLLIGKRRPHSHPIPEKTKRSMIKKPPNPRPTSTFQLLGLRYNAAYEKTSYPACTLTCNDLYLTGAAELGHLRRRRWRWYGRHERRRVGTDVPGAVEADQAGRAAEGRAGGLLVPHRRK